MVGGALPTRVLELALIYFAGYIALRFALPGETFAIAPKSYSLFVRVGSEELWAVMLGLPTLVSMLLLWLGNARMRCVACVVLAFLHSVMALFFLLGAPDSPNGGVYGGIAMLGYFSAWMAGREAV